MNNQLKDQQLTQIHLMRMVPLKLSTLKRQVLVNVEHQHLKRFVYLNKVSILIDDICFQKGFGAQKVATDFKEIERNVQEQEKMREQQAHFELQHREETQKKMEKDM